MKLIHTALLLLALASVTACKTEAQTLPVKPLVVQTQDGRDLTLQSEIADDEAERSTGLMHRTTLCESCAMVFIWPAPRPIAMWMKNTEIPLDMLFFKNNKLVYVATAVPHDLTPVSAETEVDMVLETNAGWASKNNVQTGSTLNFF